MIAKRALVPHPTDPTAMLVPLAKDKGFAIIDAKYAEAVGKHNWYLGLPSPGNRYGYPCTNTAKENGKSSVLRLHRLIARLAGFETDAEEIGRRSRSGLDCRRANLRPQNHSQNKAAQGLRSTNTSGYRGVSRYPGGKWIARINVNGKNLYLGVFIDKIEAAKAYDRAALQHFGEFAFTNFPVVTGDQAPGNDNGASEAGIEAAS